MLGENRSKTHSAIRKEETMLFSKNETAKPKKKSATPTLVLWGLASVGAYTVVSAVKKKAGCMMDGVKKWMKDKPDNHHSAQFF